MADITIPDSVYAYLPHGIDPAMLWVNYNTNADSLVVYFTGKPVPTIWNDIDDYVYIGFDEYDETSATGLMIEYFSKWLLVPSYAHQSLQPA